jgi:hypothetical protein
MFLCGLVQLYMTVSFKLHNTIWALINNIQLSLNSFILHVAGIATFYTRYLQLRTVILKNMVEWME